MLRFIGVEFGDLVMDNTHPLYQGTTGHMFAEYSRPITTKGDVNLIVGTYMMPEVFPGLDDIYAPGAQVIHFDLNAYEIAKNHRVDLGVVSDPKLSLTALATAIENRITTRAKGKSSATDGRNRRSKSSKNCRRKESRSGCGRKISFTHVSVCHGSCRKIAGRCHLFSTKH